MPSNQEQEKVKANVKKWLLEEGFKVQPIIDDKSVFRFTSADSGGMKFQVLQPIEKADEVVFVAGITVTKEQQQILQNKDNKEQSMILWKIRLGLLDAGVGFSRLSMPLDSFDVHTEIYYDGLTKNEFMKSLNKIKRALFFAFWTVDQELGEAEPQPNKIPRIPQYSS